MAVLALDRSPLQTNGRSPLGRARCSAAAARRQRARAFVLAWSGAYDEALSALELAWAGVGQPFAGLAADIVAVHRLAERARRRRVRDAKEVRQ